jgi:two-component system nitrate/nitrite response regulator NarL
VQLGARGVVLKDAGSDVLFEAVRSVMAGHYWLGRETVADRGDANSFSRGSVR